MRECEVEGALRPAEVFTLACCRGEEEEEDKEEEEKENEEEEEKHSCEKKDKIRKNVSPVSAL